MGGLKVVVVDNYSIHRSKVVKDARGRLRRQGIVLYYLPPYSPELNDIEGVFGAIKHHDMPERSYKSLDELGESIDSAFDRASRRLKSRYEYQLRPTAYCCVQMVLTYSDCPQPMDSRLRRNDDWALEYVIFIWTSYYDQDGSWVKRMVVSCKTPFQSQM
ncbi:MAG: hypothetical protein F4034_08400 [Chloroflexi bacterium]|nr:hypothetical protein [Chloroflexota bacterium]